MHVCMYVRTCFIILLDKRKQEILETMLKARDAKYSILVRYGKVLFCGASAAGKSNFSKLINGK